MSNPLLGVVTFTSGGKTYSLRFDANVICDAEEEFGPEFFGEIMAKGKATAMQMRKLFWIALKQAHPEIADERAAGALVGYAQMIMLIASAQGLAAVQEEQAGGDKNPTQPALAAGPSTGPVSSRAGARPASTRMRSGARPQGSSS